MAEPGLHRLNAQPSLFVEVFDSRDMNRSRHPFTSSPSADPRQVQAQELDTNNLSIHSSNSPSSTSSTRTNRGAGQPKSLTAIPYHNHHNSSVAALDLAFNIGGPTSVPPIGDAVDVAEAPSLTTEHYCPRMMRRRRQKRTQTLPLRCMSRAAKIDVSGLLPRSDKDKDIA